MIKKPWMSNCIAKLHMYGFTQEELAKEMGVRREHVNKMLNGIETPKGAKKRVEEALCRMIERKTSNGEA
jgi:DNA-binding XRE family transcriptional regulator